MRIRDGRTDLARQTPARTALASPPGDLPGSETPTLTREAILFPNATLSMRAAELEPPWPALLRVDTRIVSIYRTDILT